MVTKSNKKEKKMEIMLPQVIMKSEFSLKAWKKNAKTLMNCVGDHENHDRHSSKIQGFKDYAKVFRRSEGCQKNF